MQKWRMNRKVSHSIGWHRHLSVIRFACPDTCRCAEHKRYCGECECLLCYAHRHSIENFNSLSARTPIDCRCHPHALVPTYVKDYSLKLTEFRNLPVQPEFISLRKPPGLKTELVTIYVVRSGICRRSLTKSALLATHISCHRQNVPIASIGR
jgi:hypothetical protein